MFEKTVSYIFAIFFAASTFAVIGITHTWTLETALTGLSTILFILTGILLHFNEEGFKNFSRTTHIVILSAQLIPLIVLNPIDSSYPAVGIILVIIISKVYYPSNHVIIGICCTLCIALGIAIGKAPEQIGGEILLYMTAYAFIGISCSSIKQKNK